MGMPVDLVLVRHGQSEANIMQNRRKINPDSPAPEGFFDRPDSRMRLSTLGREQATKTGSWLRAEFPGGFDRYYVSALLRTVETAGTLGVDGDWIIDDRWRERDWGEFGPLSGTEQSAMYKISVKLKHQSKWYWRPPGGESLATGVRLRFEDILDTMHRELDGKCVIAVTHGEMMEVARVVLERLLPEVWQEQEDGEDYKIRNCHILHYSRRNPFTKEIGRRLEWRRSVCAHTPSQSWSGGEWRELEFRNYSDAELLDLASTHPNLLD
ncbi:MAG: histidine phosphatase family protein [Mycolicibacterium cosmeticum]|nr:histidine phosphatase family protein [Mycolicibacterium cosmeticum]